MPMAPTPAGSTANNCGQRSSYCLLMPAPTQEPHGAWKCPREVDQSLTVIQNSWLREIKYYAQGHSVDKQQSCDPNQIHLVPRPLPLPLKLREGKLCLFTICTWSVLIAAFLICVTERRTSFSFSRWEFKMIFFTFIILDTSYPFHAEIGCERMDLCKGHKHLQAEPELRAPSADVWIPEITQFFEVLFSLIIIKSKKTTTCCTFPETLRSGTVSPAAFLQSVAW